MRSGHARGDVRVDQIGHPVQRSAAVAGGEADARGPFFGEDTRLDAARERLASAGCANRTIGTLR